MRSLAPWRLRTKAPSRLEFVVFVRQLGEMLHCGVPLLTSLEVLHRDASSPMSVCAGQLIAQLESGHSFSSALASVGVKPPPALILMARIGERTGTLSQVMAEAGQWMESDAELVRSVRSALTYPLLVAAMAVALSLLLFTTTVPKLLDVVEKLGGELPLPTRVLQWTCAMLREPGTWVVVLGVGLLVTHCLESEPIRNSLRRYAVLTALELPLLGSTLMTFHQARFSHAFGLLMDKGADLATSLRLSCEMTESPRFLSDIKLIQERVAQGESLYRAMEARPDVYDTLLRSFVYLGENSATLAGAMKRVNAIYTFDLNNRLDTLKQAVEPVMTLAIGLLVGGVMIATMLPLIGVLSRL